MRTLCAVLSLMIFAASGFGEARAGDAEIIAVNASSDALDDAFEKSDVAATIMGEVAVVFLAPDAAMRTFTADLKGSFKGKPVPKQVYATEILVQRDGK